MSNNKEAIKQLQKGKAKLEDGIKKLVSEFESKYGCLVESLTHETKVLVDTNDHRVRMGEYILADRRISVEIKV